MSMAVPVMGAAFFTQNVRFKIQNDLAKSLILTHTLRLIKWWRVLLFALIQFRLIIGGWGARPKGDPPMMTRLWRARGGARD